MSLREIRTFKIKKCIILNLLGVIPPVRIAKDAKRFTYEAKFCHFAPVSHLCVLVHEVVNKSPSSTQM